MARQVVGKAQSKDAEAKQHEQEGRGLSGPLHSGGGAVCEHFDCPEVESQDASADGQEQDAEAAPRVPRAGAGFPSSHEDTSALFAGGDGGLPQEDE